MNSNALLITITISGVALCGLMVWSALAYCRRLMERREEAEGAAKEAIEKAESSAVVELPYLPARRRSNGLDGQ